MKTTIIGALAVAGSLSIGTPSQAQPLRADTGFIGGSAATTVQFRGGHGGGFHGGGFHRGGGFRGGGFHGRGFYGHGYGGRGYYGRGYGYGLGGFAAGALIGSAIASQPGYYYDDDYYVAPPRTVYETTETDGGASSDYCARRFKSYDPSSGTYLGYDGKRHPCG